MTPSLCTLCAVRFRAPLTVLLALIAALAVAACGSSSSSSSVQGQTSTHASAAAATCTAGSLPTVNSGKLTIATDSPAYPPYFVNNDPTNGKGFESAVAYAVAAKLGYSRGQGQLDEGAVRRVLRARAQEL